MKRLNILLILITLGLASWAYYLYQAETPTDLSSLIKKEGAPEYTGRRMETAVYDLQGKAQYFAAANEIKRYESSERTEFIQPSLELFDKETGAKQWRLTAEHAEITKDKMLYLRGDVKIQSLDPQSRLQRIETAQLNVDLTTQDISSDSIVKSQGMGFTTTGTGLTGNLKKQIATLTKDVKSYIEPTVIQKHSENSDK